MEALLLFPILCALCSGWTRLFASSGMVTFWSGELGASLSLLFVLCGWRTALLARHAGRSGLVLTRRASLAWLPLHLAVLGISVCCALLFRRSGLSDLGSIPEVDFLSLTANLCLVHGWFPARAFLEFWNSELWIFGVGAFWILCAPAVVVFLFRLLERGISPFVLAMGLWSASLGLALVLFRILPTSILDVDSHAWFFRAFPPQRLWEFSFGALCRLSLDFSGRLAAWRGRMTEIVSILLLCLAMLLGHLELGAFQAFWTVPAWGVLLIALRQTGRCPPAWLRKIARVGIPILVLVGWTPWIAIVLHHAGLGLWFPTLYLATTLGLCLLLHCLVVVPGRRLLERLWPLRWTD